MSIVSNASSDELDSPFYKENEMLCNRWEEFLLKNNGQINGVFNAWSFSIKSKVKTRQTWLIDVKKATYSNGNLLLSSRYQNLQETLTFRTRIENAGCPDFLIHNSRFKRSLPDHKLIDDIKELLKEGFLSKSVYEVKFKNTELTIVFHHKNDWFNMADRILAFEFE